MIQRAVTAILLGVAACTPTGADSQGGPATTAVTAVAPVPPPAPASPEETWGVQAVSLRPTFGGTLLDFRYRVLDAEKARPLFDRKIQPYLFDPASGVALGMPEDAKLGALRASPRNPPVAGKQYYVLFSSGDGAVKSGDSVTVALGDCKLDNVLVE